MMELKTKSGITARKRSYYSELVTGTDDRLGVSVQGEELRSRQMEIATRNSMLNWTIYSKNNSPVVRNLKVKDSGGHVIANERFITFPKEPTIRFPAEAFAPKVQMGRDAGPKCLVRNVEMERRRRVYKKFSLEELLQQKGLNTSQIMEWHHLPLEMFDDEDYDCRTNSEWMSLSRIDGKQYLLPAEALIEKLQPTAAALPTQQPAVQYDWQTVAVINFSEETRTWQVLSLDGLRRSYDLPRLFICFHAEDPRVFVERIAAAITGRRRAEASIKYNFYLDCMPFEGFETLSPQQRDSIYRLAIRQPDSRASMEGLEDSNIATVFREVERNYQRVMCDFECRRVLSNNAIVTNFLNATAGDSKPMRWSSAELRSKNFQEIRDYVKWNNLYVHPEVYEAMLSIVRTCQKVANMIFFNLRYGKPMSLEEFESQQLHVIHTVINYLKDRWIADISQIVRMCLRDIGKGWFDLKQSHYYIYDVMKLKRFMELTKQRMQSALRIFVEVSSAMYLSFLETPTLSVMNVEKDYVWESDLKDPMFKPVTEYTIFEIEIRMNESGPYYSTDPAVFEEKLDSLYYNSLYACHQIRQVHPMLMSNMKFAKDMFISSVGMQEELICKVRKRVKAAYKQSIIPLNAYLLKYKKYHEFYFLSMNHYIEDFNNDEEHTVFDLKDEVLQQLAVKQQYEEEIPSRIAIGAFSVNIDGLRRFLIEKRQNLANRFLETHTRKLRNEIENMLDDFRKMLFKLRVEPQNIEQLFEMKEYMETVPITIEESIETLKKMKIEYDILDVFNWNLSNEDFVAKWEALKCPLDIQIQTEATYEKLLFLEKETFWKLQLEDQASTHEKIDALIGSVASIVVQTDIKKVKEIANDIKKTAKAMKETQEFGLLLNSRQKLFGVPVRPFDKLSRLIKEFEPYKSFWLTANEWLNWYDIWMDNPLINIEGTHIDELVQNMHKTMNKSIKTFQDNPDIAEMATDLKHQMEKFKPYISVIQALRNPGMKERHLKELSEQININLMPDPDMTFNELLTLGIMQHQLAIIEVSESAGKEYAIENALFTMKQTWQNLKMEVVPFRETGTYIMKIADETQLLLDDHILSTQQITFSPFKAAFEEEIDEWFAKLKLSQEVIIIWLDVQKFWMYLEPIFSSEDISRQLPVEAKKYNTMERNWRRIMKSAYDNPLIIKVCPDRTLLESLRECSGLLEVVQKGLADYLESRRILFPRFFFLSDEELLEILAQSKNVQAVQPHLKKCFESMKSLRFEDDLTITRMYSAEDEEVVLEPPVKPEGSVEYWLGFVEESMRTSVQARIRAALKLVEALPRREWIFMWPGQVSLCGGQTSWTGNVEKAIINNDLSNYLNVMMSQLDELRELVRNPQGEIQRMMLEAIITIEVHARDVLITLIENKVANSNDFDWISQLRYYWVDDHLKVRAVNAEFNYGYEYLGNNGRLVITPLTDRCYLTLTGALHLKFGGAPAGPAGTGKTETTKDLAKAFAIQCVVFNCSDQLDFMSMGKFFKGLASSGAWACFDEFNRIDIEVLSVIAQQLMTIQKAQQMGAARFIFEGIELQLRASCAAFITMNPGYAGRTELPDNLKALFRPVAMMVPNYALIAEISLFSCGFVLAKPLAAKITATFKLSSEQLSSQDHYDFGMRSVKTVIAVAGILKREQKDMAEEQICLRSLRDVNVPKFLKDDLKLFNGIVSDLFPRIKEKMIDYTLLLSAIRNAIEEMGLKDVPEFIHKVIQLYETTIVRHGLMLVGPTGSGKTRCYEVLQKACTSLKGKDQPSGKPFMTVHTYVLNPKSITMGQLYGEYDLSTHEWTDGILSTLIRAGCNATDADKRWYVFDGPVDAVWIENMNTVLDDNKKLCLSSGEIMRLTPYQTMMFEVADLRVASPATVSRCGMVYLEPAGLGIEPFIDCWVKKLPAHLDKYAKEISNLAYFFIIPALEYLRDNLVETVESVDSCLVTAYTNLMNYQISTIKPDNTKEYPTFLFEPWSAFALIWSIGATCDVRSRYMFSDWMRELQENGRHDLQFPPEGLVYDYKLLTEEPFDQEGEPGPLEARWIKWSDTIDQIEINPEMKFADIEITTVDMARSFALIDHLATTECNILAIGPSGSGKTLTIAAKLSREMPKKYICDFIIFSARTSANQTQDLIDSKLDKRKRGVYGPPLTKKLIFFIDDLNMPALETYGAQPPIELLRQYMDFKGWYDRKEIGDFRSIEDVNIIGAMAPPGGGRNPVTARLLRHFHYLAFPEMEDETKRTIFGTILDFWLQRTKGLEEYLEPLMSASLEVFAIICKELLPTPDKSHYTFNVRDLGKVFQGVLMADATKMQSLDDVLLLWYHENFRVFSDRLTNDVDRTWFRNMLQRNVMNYFERDMNDILSPDQPLFYGDFCNPDGRYERILRKEAMQLTLTDFLEDYNSTTTIPMNLVLFEDAMSHICRITRVLRQAPGNALLLGMGGSGRQSLTKLSTHIAEYTCFQIEISKAYSVRDWREDILKLIMSTGLQDKEHVFLFSDTQIKTGLFLEDINNILSSGDVPNIYQSDDLDKIFQTMRGPVQEAGLQINRSNLLAAFQKRVRRKLHTVLTMTPIGEVFRSRLRQFPALVNLCTIDWFDPWPDNALLSVAMQFLANVKDKAITDNVLKGIVKTCQFMHSSVIRASEEFLEELNRHNYVTPTCYLELISSYGELLAKKRQELTNGINRLSTGLERLRETELEVKEMQILLEKMKPQLEAAAVNAEKMIKKIGQDTALAEEARKIAAEQESEASKLKRKNEAIRQDALADLNTAKPMLEAAEASLKALNKNDITEVKAMKRPPVGVVLVIEAICIIKKVKPNKVPGERPGEKLNDYWTPGSLLLADAGAFLSALENYNKEDLTEDIINKLKTYIENPDFQPKKVLSVSKACHSLCLWAHAMYNWYFVNLRVQPKMAALQKAEEELAITEALLAEANAKLQAVQDGLDRLQQKFADEEAKKAELERQKQLCEERMSRAVRLISGLAGEKKRWLVTVDGFKKSMVNVVGDILLSAGAIAYLTPFIDKYRKRLLTSWYQLLGEGVPHTPGCSPVSVLGDPVEIRNWQIDGLPRDALSVENAVLVMNSKRWPLFIDPQGQANTWIRNLGKGNVSIVRMTDKDLLRVVESCVRFGRVCLIENVALELEASLDTVLMRALFKQAGVLSIKIGDNIVPYSFDFRLYLTTKLPNPHYAPEIAVKVLLVNFTLTASGLTDQMLSLVVMQERPELEETRSQLIVSSAQLKHELKDIEDRILYRLSLSEGSAVDDIDLILTLEASKVKSEEIKIKVEFIEITQADIDSVRSLYIPVAERAQILFFCLLDLQQVDPMYQYSLEWFIRIFINSIVNTESNDDVGVRVADINDYFTFSLYTNVCRSLFEKNKLHFAFLLCVRIQMKEGIINGSEWRFLLSGAIPMEEEPNPAPEWMSTRVWSELQSLQTLEKFQTFIASYKMLLNEFKRIFDSNEPESAVYPEPWNTYFDDFQKMLVLKCLRPDKVTNAMQMYISKYFGSRFIEPQTSGLDALYKESSPVTPLVFVLSSGTDPASELFKFADKLRMVRKLFTVSLGQGQGPRAELLLKQSLEVGNWVFFQNCHLAPSWMPKLEILVETLPPDSVHRDFRLWLTSMPSAAFPVSILQNSSKMTVEPPRGVKANMLRGYNTHVFELQEFLELEDNPKVPLFKALIFSLTLFHSTLLERRKFGPLGFNIPYEFTDGDYAICVSQLHMFLMEYDETPYKVLIYTAGHINYGGRITDDWDRRCVLTILERYYRKEVLDSGYQFDSDGKYVQPSLETTYDEYIDYVKKLPINDAPNLFGLHQNADISYAQAETYTCLETLLALQPKEIGGAVKGMDEVVGELGERILSQLPPPFDLKKIAKKYPVMYEESYNTVLLQEAMRYNGLVVEMASSLKDLLLSLKGLVVMSDKLEAMADAMYNNKVPENWTNVSFASLKPLGSWVEDLKERLKFIRNWEDHGIPTSFWISGFYFPQAFLTGTLQNYARKYTISIDSVDFAFEVLHDKPKSRPTDGCAVYGLFLEGCRWDGSSLAESYPKELFTDMPPILMRPELNHKKAGVGFYECPVYKTVVRAGTLSTTGHSTNFVLPMEIPSREPGAHWTVRGVALICSLNF